MKVTDNRDVDILTLELEEDLPIVDAVQSGAVITHLSDDGLPVLIEIPHARSFVTSIVEAVMQPQAAEA